ncbi:MAG: methyltransferase [Treponema sp.]|nr:methyltransferase [Treponema sp.]
METIITDKITFGGNCIAKLNGKNIFVPYAIPGEKLQVEIVENHRDYDLAKIVNILEASKDRVEPACPYYYKCGGCNMMHIKEDAQRIYRKEILKDTFERNGVEVPEITVIHGNNFGYRARFQLNNGGLSEKGSNNIIPITECKIAEKNVNQWLSDNSFENRPKGRCHLFSSEKVYSVGENTEKKFAIAHEEKKTPEVDFSKTKKNKNIKQIKKRYSGSMISEDNTVTVEISGKKISFDVRGFFQSNMEVLEKSIKQVCLGLKGDSVLDMYAGCGTFSLFLTDIFKKVTLVEHNRDALVFAEKNLLGKNHESIGLSGAKWCEMNNKNNFDAVVIDPPRSGMEKAVRDWLCNSNIPQIRSVSCDPATHARDASILIKAGYKLDKVFLLDFYPNTSHIESLAYFSKV